jgi:hypothetical protein
MPVYTQPESISPCRAKSNSFLRKLARTIANNPLTMVHEFPTLSEAKFLGFVTGVHG